jgi:miniconductance mechanosensitive channel
MLLEKAVIQQDGGVGGPDWFNAAVIWLGEHQLVAQLVATALLLIVAYIADKLAKWILERVTRRIVAGTAFTWDDVLVRAKVFKRLAHIAPALAIYYGIELIPGLSDTFTSLVQHAAGAALIVVAVVLADAVLTAIGEIYSASPMSKGRPIRAYIQAVKIVVYILGLIVAVATVLGQSPAILLSGAAAFSAVLLLIFRDTILSFVASSHISNYDMMRVGDWIEVPQYGADGDVVDIGLHTIRVQNWDKTITTIPTHKFLTDSFKNWRAMSQSGGRRIKRALYIDMNSIRFLEESDLKRFEKFALLKDYIAEKRRAIEEDNAARAADIDVVANARLLTNIGTFREYVVRYLRNHAKVHQQMTLIVRQLDPTPEGLPLEIYAFSNDVGWVKYEAIQSDIFDHLIAVIPEFDLRLFQVPSGRDFEAALGGK